MYAVTVEYQTFTGDSEVGYYADTDGLELQLELSNFVKIL